jgi:MFS transporter, AAHS family, benzoate transport protein
VRLLTPSKQQKELCAMRKIDINQVIDQARFNAFHWRVLFWCGLIIIFDGYDLVTYGVVLPALMKDWGLTPLQAGALGSYALFGAMLGAIVFGSLSDRVGRKWTIAVCVILFSGFTLLNGFARNTTEFGLCRFLAGLGIGGVMPNVVALMSEYAPKKIRGTLVAIMFSGYSVGGILSSGLGIVLLPGYGWQSVFYIAAIPLMLLPLIVRYLPESIAFMIRQGREAEAKEILHRIAPAFVSLPDDTFAVPALKAPGAPVIQLFREGRGVSTIMLCLVFFCCLLMIYALNSWLPKLMISAGYGLGSSLSFLLLMNVGAIFGAVGGGWIGDRLGLRKVLIVFFLLAAVSIGLLGFKSPTSVLYTLIFIAGATTIGTQILAYSCVAEFFPMGIRTTGLGWISGIGRSGAISGPILGGFLVNIQLPLHLNFIVFAIPGCVAALAMCFVRQRQVKLQAHRSTQSV